MSQKSSPLNFAQYAVVANNIEIVMLPHYCDVTSPYVWNRGPLLNAAKTEDDLFGIGAKQRHITYSRDSDAVELLGDLAVTRNQLITRCKLLCSHAPTRHRQRERRGWTTSTHCTALDCLHVVENSLDEYDNCVRSYQVTLSASHGCQFASESPTRY